MQRVYRKNYYGEYTELRPFLGEIAKIVPPGFMPKTLEAFPSRELGCGSYGCAYRACKKGWVIKVTNDPLEADLAEVISRQRSKVPSAGMVKFGGVIQLEDSDTWLIWREEAKDVGSLTLRDLGAIVALGAYERCMPSFLGFRNSRPELRKIIRIRSSASYKRTMAAAMRVAASFKAFPKHAYEWHRPLSMRELTEGLYKSVRGRSNTRSKEAAADLAAADLELKLLTTAGRRGVKWAQPLKPIVKTLSWLAARGLYLADMHDENCGYVRRNGKKTLVLTDPRMLVLREDPLDIHVVYEDDGDW